MASLQSFDPVTGQQLEAEAKGLVASARGKQQPGDWADSFLLDGTTISRLHAWAIFHDATHYDTSSTLPPVPPIPPMVLHMLNHASAEVWWALDVDNGWTHAIGCGKMPFGGRIVKVAALLQPNWWRNFVLKYEPNPASFTALPLRMRRLGASLAVTSVTYLADCRSLVELNLGDSLVTSEGLDGLSRIPTLTKLNLSCCSGVTSVSCLDASKSLVELDLSDTLVTSAGLVGLERIPTLTKLNLSCCSGVTSVSCLGVSASLVELDLAFTSTTSEGMKGLERIPTLRKLNLMGCKGVSNVAIVNCFTADVEVTLPE